MFFCQCSLLRVSAPLESLIRDKLSAKQPEAFECFWSKQVPVSVTSFVNYFEGDPCFTAATAMYVFLHVEVLHDEFEVMLILFCFQVC